MVERSKQGRPGVRTRAGRWVVVWVALVVAGTLLALVARGVGPLPGDLALTRLL